MSKDVSPLNLAFSALIAEQLEDLTDRLDSQPKPEALNIGVLADLLAARLQPQIDLMNERQGEHNRGFLHRRRGHG
jgi:hypothetical protein